MLGGAIQVSCRREPNLKGGRREEKNLLLPFHTLVRNQNGYCTQENWDKQVRLLIRILSKVEDKKTVTLPPCYLGRLPHQNGRALSDLARAGFGNTWHSVLHLW